MAEGYLPELEKTRYPLVARRRRLYVPGAGASGSAANTESSISGFSTAGFFARRVVAAAGLSAFGAVGVVCPTVLFAICAIALRASSVIWCGATEGCEEPEDLRFFAGALSDFDRDTGSW